MPPFRRYPDKRKQRPPFDFFDDDFDLFDDLECFFDEICQSGSDISFEAEELVRDEKGIKKHIVRGFCIETRPDGTTRFREFGSHPLKNRGKDTMIAKESKPVTDIIEGKKEIAVTVDIPGVEREDIDLNVVKDVLEITVPNRKYHKCLDLPCSVKPDTMKATYRNGILDIVLKKKTSAKDRNSQ